MSFDMDLHRDAVTAFGRASITSGALLPFEGRALVRAEDGPPPAALDAQTDGWLSKDNPVLVRGPLRILPLAWAGDGSGATPDEIAKFAAGVRPPCGREAEGATATLAGVREEEQSS